MLNSLKTPWGLERILILKNAHTGLSLAVTLVSTIQQKALSIPYRKKQNGAISNLQLLTPLLGLHSMEQRIEGMSDNFLLVPQINNIHCHNLTKVKR